MRLFPICLLGLLMFVTNASAGSQTIAREYVEKSGFVADLRGNLEKANRGQSPQFEKLLKEIDFKKIEGLYVEALARDMNNEELTALVQSLSIPGLHAAIKKQGKIALGLADPILKEVEAAAKKVGIGKGQIR